MDKLEVENYVLNIEQYLDEKINYYEQLLAMVKTAKEFERGKTIRERRDFRMMFKLDKDESVFSICLEELKAIKKKLNE